MTDLTINQLVQLRDIEMDAVREVSGDSILARSREIYRASLVVLVEQAKAEARQEFDSIEIPDTSKRVLRSTIH